MSPEEAFPRKPDTYRSPLKVNGEDGFGKRKADRFKN
jgi:hypothetical protein